MLDTNTPFFMYFLDCQPEELKNPRRSEVSQLRTMAEEEGINCECSAIKNIKALLTAMSDSLFLLIEKYDPIPYIIHISAAGDSEGIIFQNGERIDWAELRRFFIGANRLSGFRLVLCISSPNSFDGIQMGLEDNDIQQSPFCYLLGQEGVVDTATTVDAYRVFYRGLLNGLSPENASTQMMIESGKAPFILADYATLLEKAESDRTPLYNKNTLH